MNLRIIDANGETQSVCTLREYRNANEESPEAMCALVNAFVAYFEQGRRYEVAPGAAALSGPCANAWGGGGAAPLFGIRIED